MSSLYNEKQLNFKSAPLIVNDMIYNHKIE